MPPTKKTRKTGLRKFSVITSATELILECLVENRCEIQNLTQLHDTFSAKDDLWRGRLQEIKAQLQEVAHV